MAANIETFKAPKASSLNTLFRARGCKTLGKPSGGGGGGGGGVGGGGEEEEEKEEEEEEEVEEEDAMTHNAARIYKLKHTPVWLNAKHRVPGMLTYADVC